VTTRAVEADEELLTTYGCEYWLADKPRATPMLSQDVQAHVQQAAQDLLHSSSGVALVSALPSMCVCVCVCACACASLTQSEIHGIAQAAESCNDGKMDTDTSVDDMRGRSMLQY
jgi:hypothetical protein